MSDSRGWLRSALVCPALAEHQIAHLGASRMPAPFEIVRTKLGGSYFLCCTGGSGRVLVDGRWKACGRDQAFLLPPGTLHAFFGESGAPWEFCWVRYRERRGQKPIGAAASPVLAGFHADPFRHAVLGLYAECRGEAIPAAVQGWVDQIQRYVLRFAQPAQIDPRIWRLWESVAAELSADWTSAAMAKAAGMSEKHLERLCRRELGRTPRQQLIWLRMRRAAELLAASNDKIEAIAAEVGYQNAFVFSSTFKRIMGWSPSRYPGRQW
ncbi:MAG: AraC family transcriptional regulator [Verrucomicrobiales bacterium]